MCSQAVEAKCVAAARVRSEASQGASRRNVAKQARTASTNASSVVQVRASTASTNAASVGTSAGHSTAPKQNNNKQAHQNKTLECTRHIKDPAFCFLGIAPVTHTPILEEKAQSTLAEGCRSRESRAARIC